MNIRLTKPAIRQVGAALAYVATRSPQGAANIAARLSEILDVLADRPNVGRPTTRPRFRQIGLAPYPYLIDYYVQGDEVVVVRFRHAARRA